MLLAHKLVAHAGIEPSLAGLKANWTKAGRLAKSATRGMMLKGGTLTIETANAAIVRCGHILLVSCSQHLRTATMAQRLLSVPWIYWSVLRALVLSLLGIAFWAIFNSLLGFSDSATQNDEPIYEGGVWWLFYTVGAVVLTCVVAHAGAPGWLIKVTIAALVVAVPPLYWAFHREPPPMQKPDIAGLANLALPGDISLPDLEAAAHILRRPSAGKSAAQAMDGIPGPTSGQS